MPPSKRVVNWLLFWAFALQGSSRLCVGSCWVFLALAFPRSEVELLFGFSFVTFVVTKSQSQGSPNPRHRTPCPRSRLASLFSPLSLVIPSLPSVSAGAVVFLFPRSCRTPWLFALVFGRPLLLRLGCGCCARRAGVAWLAAGAFLRFRLALSFFRIRRAFLRSFLTSCGNLII